MAAYDFRRCARIAWAPCLGLLLQGCAAEAIFYTVLIAAEVADAVARESTLQDALVSRTFSHPLIVVVPALDQAAQLDGRRAEGGYRFNEGLIVSYTESPSTGGAGGSVTVKMYSRHLSTTVIILRGPRGSEEAGRKVGEQLLDAMAADLADIERRVTTKTVAVDVATVFDALGQVGQRQNGKVLTRDAPSHSLRVSYPYFVEGRNAEGFLDISCVAEGGSTIVTLVGDAESPAVAVRKAANAVLAALTGLLRQPE